jgi:hypothetical protein
MDISTHFRNKPGLLKSGPASNLKVIIAVSRIASQAMSQLIKAY